MRINGLEFTAVEGDLTCRDCHLDKCGSCKDVLCTDGERASTGKKGCIYVVDGDIKDLIKPKYGDLELKMKLASACLHWYNEGAQSYEDFSEMLYCWYMLGRPTPTPHSNLSFLEAVEELITSGRVRHLDYHIFVDNEHMLADAEEILTKKVVLDLMIRGGRYALD